jgi:HEAT repeat protein
MKMETVLMSKKSFDKRLESLEILRQSAPSAQVENELRKALSNRSNYLVAKAADIVRQHGLNSLIPDLLVALERFYTDPVKSDPQCWAKNAIVTALADLGHDDAEVFIRGLRHVQPEPVWGGQQDTAGPLRGKCALALVACRGLSDLVVLSYLIETLVDGDKTVRIESARAIGRINRPEAALLLRLRALVGDAEPEVPGACFSGVLAIEGRQGLDFVRRFLETRDAVSEEAALALGLTHEEDALAILIDRWERERESEFGSVLLSAIAISRLSDGLEFLMTLVEGDSGSSGSAAQALASTRPPDELRPRIEAVARRSPQLRAILAKHLG